MSSLTPDLKSVSMQFATTRWSLVIQARDKSAPQADAALADLCRAYWYPLYAFVRKRSRDEHEAQDLTQSFFARLLQKDFLENVAPERGRFRAFLLAAIKHFICNEWDREKAAKRGGDRRIVSLDSAGFDWDSCESRFLIEPSHELTPERLFERQWALALLERVLNRLRDENVASGTLTMFQTLQPFLTHDRESANYAQAAALLNSTESAMRSAARRLRKRFRALLRDEIAHTVATSEDIEDEIRDLIDILSAP